MRKAAFSMAILLLSAVWVVAQTAGTGQAGTPAQSPTPNTSMPQSSGTAQNPQTQSGTPQGQTPATPQNNPPSTTPATNPQAAPQTGTTTQPGTPSQPGSTPQTATGPQTTVEGCLSGTPGEYSLITKSGQVYSLAGDDSLLGNHVGEEVRVTGAQSNSSAAGASAPSATPGNSASTTTGGSAYGSTGTAGSQPGATTQSQTGSVPNQSNPPAGQPGSSPGSAANSPAAASTTQSGTPQIGSGTRFQVSNVTETSGFCNMAQPH